MCISTAVSKSTHLWKYFWWLSSVVANITWTKRVVHLSKSSKISTKTIIIVQLQTTCQLTTYLHVLWLEIHKIDLLLELYNEQHYLFQYNKTQKLSHLNTFPQFPQVNSATPHSLSLGIASYLVLQRWHFDTYQRVLRNNDSFDSYLSLSHFRSKIRSKFIIFFLFIKLMINKDGPNQVTNIFIYRIVFLLF